MIAKIAENRCCKCSFEWQDKSGMLAAIKSCPRCGSLYWFWVNYEGN